MDLANWALHNSPKFTIGVKYQFHQGFFDQIRNPNHPSPHIYHQHHQSVLPKGRSFTAYSGTKAAVLLKGRSSTANSGTKAAVLLGIDICGSFSLLFAPNSLLAYEQTLKDLKRSQGHQRGDEESGFG